MRQTALLLLFSCLTMFAGDPIAWVELSEPQQGYMLRHIVKNDPNDEPYNVQTEKGGKPCIFIPKTKYAYFDVNDGILEENENNLIFRITFYDEGHEQLKLQYNSTAGDYTDAVLHKGGTNEWVTATICINDALFRNAQNQHADFRINDNNYINRIEICTGSLDPMTEPLTQHLGGSTYSDMHDKSVAGYQAWFGTGQPDETWQHWSSGRTATDGTRWPSAGNCSFDIYPDITIYEEDILEQTGFEDLGNGSEAKLFASNTENAIQTHFGLMKTHGIDGVAVQRFINPEMKSIVHSPTATLNLIRQAAEQNERIFYVCYDISSNGLENSWADIIKFDWVYNIEQNYNLTQSPAYATMDGKPVVEIWGTGFTGNHPGTASETIELIEFLKQRGCYVIGGVPTYWRENKNDAKGPSQTNPADQESFEAAYKHYDMISPWMVGRFGNINQYEEFKNLIINDINYCQQHGMQYLPVVFPGFSWALWNSGTPNQIPRMAGDFLWTQIKRASDNGFRQVYFAMFDEYDEGTALLNAATDYNTIPKDAWFLTNSADGTWCSADFYLRLAGDATRQLRQGTVTDLVNTPYSCGPVYYRNSFEMRQTDYNFVNGTMKNNGFFPVDPCMHNNGIMFQNNLSSHEVSIKHGNANNGQYALHASIRGNGQAYFKYQIAELKIPVTECLELICQRKGNIGIEIALSDGTEYQAGIQQYSDQYEPLRISITQQHIGDTICSLRLIYYGHIENSEEAWIDDVLIQKTQCTTNIDGTTLKQGPDGLYDLWGRPAKMRKGEILIKKTANSTEKIITW